MRIAVETEPASLFSGEDGAQSYETIEKNVFEALTWLNADGGVEPWLAASWQWTDSTTLRIKLRPGVKFHNGSAMTAADVLASFEVVKKVGTGATGLQNLVKGSISKVDDLTIDIKLPTADPLLPLRIANFYVSPAGPDPVAMRTNPIGTGHYKFAEWKRGDSLTLERFADYWGSRTGPTRVQFLFRKEAAVRQAMILRGEADLANNMPVALVKSLPQQFIHSSSDTAQLFMNMSPEFSKRPSPLLADRRVREALNISINRSGISTALFGGTWTPAANPSQPQALGTIAALKPYPYEPARAKQLISDAGATGKTLIVIGSSDRWPLGTEVQEALAQGWRQAGLNVDMRLLASGVWVSDGLRKLPAGTAEFDVIVNLSHGNEENDEPSRHALGYTCGSNGKPGPSLWNGTPASACDLMMKAFVESDLGQRAKLSQQAIQQLYDGFYIAPLWHTSWIWGGAANVKFTPRFDGRVALWEIGNK